MIAPQKDPQTFAIIGACMAVHGSLGFGFLEAVYQEALAIELHHADIPFQREQPIAIRYRNQVLAATYRADFICHGDVIVELKAISKLMPEHEAQLLHYLKATGVRRGLLVNFGSRSLEYKRLVFGYKDD